MRYKFQLYIISMWILFFLLFVNKISIPICFGDDCRFVGWTDLLAMNIVPFFSFLLMIMGAIFYLRFNYVVIKGAPTLPKRVTKIEDLNYETLSFLVTYIVPLVCFDLDFDLAKNRNLLMLILVLSLMGWIYIKSNMFYTNPTLAVLGFRIYKINTEQSEGVIIIVKGKLQIGDSIYPRMIDDKIYYAKKAGHDTQKT